MRTLKEKFAAGSYQFAVRIRNHVILNGPVVILSAAEGSCFGGVKRCVRALPIPPSLSADDHVKY